MAKPLMTPTSRIDSTLNTPDFNPQSTERGKRQVVRDYQRTLMRKRRAKAAAAKANKLPNKCIDCLTRAYCPEWEAHKKHCESHRKELTKPLHDVSVDYTQDIL